MGDTNKKKPGAPGQKAVASDAAPKETAEQKASTIANLTAILGDLAGDIGPLQHSCRPKPLTENEAEYTVQVIKHVFKEHIVLELYVSNTVQGIVLENIEAKLTGLAPNFVELGAAPIEKLENGGSGSAYVVIQRQNPGEDVVTCSIGAALRFIVKEEG